MNKKYIYVLSIVFLTIIGLTYSYFSFVLDTTDGSSNIIAETGTLELQYIDGPLILLDNIYPDTTFTKEIIVKNIGTLNTSYDIVWKEYNNTIENNELVYSIECNSYKYYGLGNQVNYGVCDELNEMPVNNNGLLKNIGIDSEVTHVFTITFKFNDTNSNQNYNQGKLFNGVININENVSPLVTIKKVLSGVSDFSSSIPYVGEIVKINGEFLSNYNIETTKEYLYDKVNKDIYSIDGEIYDGITYHTLKEYNFITGNNSSEINKAELMELKYHYIDQLKLSQIANGAFPAYGINDDNVNPYFAETISIGLLADMNSFKEVRDYLEWHLNHINMTPDVNGQIGTIYDYDVNRTTLVETTTNEYDSEDSYAALLYVLLYNYYLKTHDTSLFTTYKSQIEATLQSLESIYNTTLNMTVAKTTYRVYYAMDNAEVVEGYKNLSYIYRDIYNDNEKYTMYNNRYNTMKQSVYNNFYNEEDNMIDWVYTVSSKDDIATNFYPNVAAQFYFIYYGIVEPNSDMAKHLYYLTSYYSTPTHFDWYNYDYIMVDSPNLRFSNNNQIYTALLMDSVITTDGTTINIKDEVSNAFDSLYSISKMDINSYRWYLGENATTLMSIDKFMDKINTGW